MLTIVNTAAPVLAPIAAAASTPSVKLGRAEGYSILASITNSTPGAKNFGAVSGNNITITAHGFATGLVGQCTTTGALPTGLSTSTNYYVIVVDANTISLASSLANAQAGTAVTLSSAGSGTNTFTATALAGATCKIQISEDGVTWGDLASSSQNITATGVLHFTDNRPFYEYVKLTFAITAGQLTPVFTMTVKQ